MPVLETKEEILKLLQEEPNLPIHAIEKKCHEHAEDEIEKALLCLFLEERIQKNRQGDDILFSLFIPKPTTEDETGTKKKKRRKKRKQMKRLFFEEDTKNVSLLARKFRSCRFSVERDVCGNSGLQYALKVTKNEKTCFISYFSSISSLGEGMFDKMLQDDESVRIVASSTEVKMAVAKEFQDYISKFKDEESLQEFRLSHGFCFLTLDQFFESLGWRKLVE